MSTPQERVAKYYSRLDSRIGYRIVMGRSQHFGYYDSPPETEQEAQQKYHAQFSKLLDIRAGMTLLDAGCGQGVVACDIANNFDVKVTGITIVPAEVAKANATAARLGVGGRTSFMYGDYSATNFDGNSFDRMYTTETLSHSPDVAATVRELCRITKRGGMLLFAEYELDYDVSNDIAKGAQFVKDYAAIHGIFEFKKGNFRRILQEAGLLSIEEHDWTARIKPSCDRLRRLAEPSARLAKTLRIEKYMVNSMAARLYSDGIERGAFRYVVYSARKFA